MKPIYALLLAGLAASGCTPPQRESMAQTGKEVGESVKQTGKEIYESASYTAGVVVQGAKGTVGEVGDHFQKWTARPSQQAKHAVPSSYCYKAQTDILCYRQPMPGWEHRLVGYQGTDAEPPPLATMKPLPMVEPDNSQSPEARAASAKPVFVQPPPPVTDTPGAGETQGAAAPTNPALSPQI